ncbi:MAG: gamma-glutamylcyclotransferase family protein [Cellulosilyticaceae bacterium]
MEKIFVYGSLMSGFWNYDKVLKNRVRKVEKAFVKGELYQLPAGYPAIVDGKAHITGEVMTITQQKLMKSLDLLEGYMGEGEDNLYERHKKEVLLEDGRVEECWVYVYVDQNEARRDGEPIRHGNWRKYIQPYLDKK